MDSKKCFEKYFLVFGCVPKNPLENPFLSCFSHFLRIQTNIIKQILLQRIKIYKQPKKQKSKIKITRPIMRERERERERERKSEREREIK